MRFLDNLAMALLLIAAVANAGAHYLNNAHPDTRVIGAPFACAALAVAGMLMLLLLGFTQPDWAARGTLFLLLALAMLGAAGWFLRARLRLLRRMMD